MRKTPNHQITKIDGVLEHIIPSETLPLVFDSPHSGTHYPKDFDYACDFKWLEMAEDKYVDELFSDAPDYGASLLKALFPRTYMDVNRAHDDIDEELLSENWPSAEPINPSNRSYAGIGLIRRLVKPGMPVYNRGLSVLEFKKRLLNYYTPYHEALENRIEEAHYNYGKVWHVNCHSMPSGKTGGTFNRINPFQTPDFVLGDRNGTSCDLDFTHALRDFLKSKRYKVAINDPYKGVELVERYSAPATGRHSIQIEISRALYMDEETCQKNNNYNKLKDDLNSLIEFCAGYTKANLTQIAAD